MVEVAQVREDLFSDHYREVIQVLLYFKKMYPTTFRYRCFHAHTFISFLFLMLRLIFWFSSTIKKQCSILLHNPDLLKYFKKSKFLRLQQIKKNSTFIFLVCFEYQPKQTQYLITKRYLQICHLNSVDYRLKFKNKQI